MKTPQQTEAFRRSRAARRPFARLMSASMGSICLLMGISSSSAGAATGRPTPSSAGALPALTSRTMAGYTAQAPPSKKHLATVTATFVMPPITCPATGNSSLGVSAVISDASSVFAAIAAGGSADGTCTNGVPSFGLQAYEGPNGVVSAPGIVLPGDTVQIVVTQTRSKLTATVRDMSRGGLGVSTGGKPRKNKKPMTVAVITQGGSGPTGSIASFGTVRLTQCSLDASPLGGDRTLRAYDLANSAGQTEVSTGSFDATNTSFSETFVRAA